ADGEEVRTVEGLATDGELSALQRAFLEHGGAQCGICTPGMLLSAAAYLRDDGAPNADRIRGALAGNLCRCTGYQHIVTSVVEAAKAKRRKTSLAR
ncbi:MAG TPA: 2Fe-2S iron-sulfur cluster-binding protein, partial [Vicinamibacteria bacterium]